MSQNENKFEALEEEKKVVVTPDDVRGALDFFKHFEIAYPQSLQDAVDNFVGNQTFENQQRLKYELCKTMATSEHEAFKDEMFQKIIKEVTEVSYDMQFDYDLERTLSETDSK
jgi:hypothetical protein